MKEIEKDNDDWGEKVIYVKECDKYEYEDPEKPKNDLHNEDEEKFYAIMELVENYYCK